MHKMDSRRPSHISDISDSHMTILRPRDSMPSDAMSVFGALMPMDETDNWHYKAKFLCRTLTFCLGPGNLWRFPRQAFLFGNATYFYLYTLYTWFFGLSLLVFEIGLGQYFAKGFAGVFAVCPIMKGITISMVFYCLTASVFYNMVNMYSFLYIFSGFYSHMPHSFCSSHIKKEGCIENSTNQTHSPEYIYFFSYVVKGVDIYGEKSFNWRNAGVLILIIVLISFMIVFALIKSRWFSVAICCTILLTLLVSFITSLSVDSSKEGLKKMFVPTENNIGQLATWIYPIEQTIVSLGLGAGPMVTFWPLSKTRSWSYTECLIINSIVFTCTIFSGIIFFNAAGVVARSKNDTIQHLFGNSSEEIQQHIIVTQFFNTMSIGISNVSVLLFNFLLFCSCLTTMLEYAHTILLYINSYAYIREIRRTRVIIAACLFFYLLGLVSVIKCGYLIMISIDKIFISTSLVILLSCEMIALSYLYGMRNLCDDIEFVLGYVPNYYFQITWLFLPALLIIVSICSIYLKCKNASNIYDRIVLALLIVFIVLPIIIFAVYKLIIATKTKNFHGLLSPIEAQSVNMESDEEVKSGRAEPR